MAVGLDARIFIGDEPPARAGVANEELPFRILVLGNFSGRRSDPPALGQRRPVRIDIDTFDAAFAELAPSLSLDLTGVSVDPVDVAFASLDDFEPDAVFSKLALFARMRELRVQLADAATFEQAAAELRAAQPASTAAFLPEPEDDSATLERLLGRPPGDPAVAAKRPSSPVESVVDRLVQGLVAPYIVPATAHLQRPLIDALDSAISASMRLLLRHPQWRALEGRWRALDRFVRRVELDGPVVLELLDVEADELLHDFMQAQGDVGASAVSAMLATRRSRQGEDEGWTLIVGLFEFGPSAAELALLAALGAMAATAGAVFLGSAASRLLELEALPKNSQPPRPEWEAALRWRSLRESWVASHIGLVWPRVLARLPFGAKAQPVDSFAFEELGDGFSHERLLWRSATLDCAALLAAAFTDAGWDMNPHDHLDVEDLPAWIDRSESPPRLQAVAELFSSEREVRLAQVRGVMPLVSHRSLPHARLAGWQSIAIGEKPLAGRWQRTT